MNEVDEQHQELISMLEGVRYAIEEHVPADELEQLADTLQNSFITHFSAEERNYENRNFPEDEAHRRDHKNLLDNVSRLKGFLSSSSWQLALDLTESIKYSFLSHVTEFDDRFASDIDY